MTREAKDRGGLWLVEHYGGAVLRLAGVTGFRAWRPSTTNLALPKQVPDGVLEVFFPDQPEPDTFVIEFMTYPDRRADDQGMRDALLLFLSRGRVPELVTVVLHPKGNLRVAGELQLSSRLGTTRVGCAWRVVELWTLAAADLLAAGDVGLIPWVPLTQYEGTPEALIQQCKEQIDRLAKPAERSSLLAVAQVMTGLRFPDAGLLTILGGSQAMIESPLIQELLAQTRHEDILQNLDARFGSVPPELATEIRAIFDDQRLRDLHRFAALCPDLAAFRARLSS